MAAPMPGTYADRIKRAMQGQNPGGTTGAPPTLGSPSDRGPSLPGLGKKLLAMNKKKLAAQPSTAFS